MKTATFVKCLSVLSGDARLYALSGGGYVVVSAVDADFSGPETYIFASDEKGNVLDWTELDGSFRGEFNHKMALENAGYEVIDAA